uniref:HEPN domain-containing protein n=1 Tax=Candidatus Electronema sp. TaxID=2698783 RepID=UPI00405742A5
MIDYEGFRKVGKFTLNSGVEVFGELSLNGMATTLKLYSDSLLIHPTDPLKQYNYSSDIFGILYDDIGVVYDQSKVSLIKCINTGSTGSDPVHKPNDKYFCEIFFPYIILFGNQHILSSDRIISGINFTTDDAQDIFYEPYAFGSINSSTVEEAKAKFDQLIEQDALILGGFERKRIKAKAEILPYLFYYNGNKELLTVDTVFGKIFIKRWITGGPSKKGIHIDSNINIYVTFNENKSTKEAIETLRYLMVFFDIIAGRKQSVLKFKVIVNDYHFDVYLCDEQRRQFENTQNVNQLSNLPIQATEKSDEFSQILQSWVERHEEWRNARFRFSTSFDHQNSYNNDRLIAAANMFDILPVSACPQTDTLSSDLEEARCNARKMFNKLPVSPERDSILNALGRIGKPSLKRKIRYRAKLITDLVGEHFPEIELVLDQAVDCRNYYVHGTETKIDYSKNTGQIVFFTDTLEFVFAVSDLIESGWNITAWMNNYPACSSHPFGRYIYSYRERLEALKKLLAKKV